ncbi:PREDICTED: nudix hydrolase 12, mitochondrial-like isoform X2 [Nelumbo nucifera]|uniref:Nudix hydrolase domain-containing protein n=2 Tax=Nelumbo nucifera TaxID=4432 RepID=A0A822YE03_NELNU|nr:PREDICTED: nudix hydrolase 12, mitochondrial-like isoform X2 [Nelumbo nucifera]DAD30373.1 TPA_asm: hypothetical protein HUJ06_009224 [Nelumbo nucifera]
MSSVVARTGRQRQRYEDQLRLVAGCIPYRIKDAEDQSCDLVNRLEVLMVSSPNRDDLVFPKGGWEDDETVGEAACREALEEAGVKGILDENQLGVWEFRSKSRQDSCCLAGGCRGYMFALKITEELESWPEQAYRDRKWLTVREAFRLCRYEWMSRALEQFLGVISENSEHEEREDLIGGSPSVAGPDVVAEHQILPPNCFVKPSGSQHLDEPHDCVVQG